MHGQSKSGWLLAGGVAAALASLPASASADDGPVDAIGNMMKASPTLTVVSIGVVLAANTSFTVLAATSAISEAAYPSGVYVAQLAVAAPQAVGYAAAPSFFDISRWRPLESIFLLLPAQGWSTALTVHAAWSLSPEPGAGSQRLLGSAFVGGHYAFTATALGGLVHEKWLPFELGIFETTYGAGSLAFSIAQAASLEGEGRSDEQGLWVGLSVWSLLLTAHGVGSILVEAPGSRVSSREDAPSLFARPQPYLAPTPGGLMAGARWESF